MQNRWSVQKNVDGIYVTFAVCEDYKIAGMIYDFFKSLPENEYKWFQIAEYH
jgi:hypothetical protein